jgi:hypothetical protein
MASSSVDNAKTFWENRSTFVLSHDENIADKIAQYEQSVQRRTESENVKRSNFLETHTFESSPVDAFGVNQIAKLSSDIKFWCVYNSWSFCSNCNSLKKKSMPFNFIKRSKNAVLKDCVCKQDRYVVPKYDDIPQQLVCLTSSDVQVLRPFYFKFDHYERHAHGYRVKCCPMRLKICHESVVEKINNLTDATAKNRCQVAYDYLMLSEESSYSHFVHLRESLLARNESLNLFNFIETQGIECALWPNLYPFTNWCESKITDSGSRRSSKVSFNTKVFSEIVDYALHFDLLQFQYDRWLYKTVSGAVNTARILKCSPARSLDTKLFSATYWQWQHRFVLDAVHQFGLPDVFITISPFEWSFPFPKWLDHIRLQTAKEPTELAGYETAHIVHILAELVRGYLCGSNSNRWSNHIFSYNSDKNRSNVKTYFYRFEFQKRGTAHLHLLVWLNDITKIQHKYIRADIPKDNADLAYLATTYQKSDKPSASLKLQEEESFFTNVNGTTTFHIQHPADAFACNLRAYIATVLPSLECSMDFQTTDNRAMLLRYVTSYVTKWQDGISSDALFCHNISGGQAAVRYVMQTQPAEPEMWLALSSTKVSWSSSRTKRYTVPTSDKANEDNTVNKYRNRSTQMSTMSLLEWLRNVDHSKANPKEYRGGNTLVGVKVVSLFNTQ